jgi:hypothetical protein
LNDKYISLSIAFSKSFKINKVHPVIDNLPHFPSNSNPNKIEEICEEYKRIVRKGIA